MWHFRDFGFWGFLKTDAVLPKQVSPKFRASQTSPGTVGRTINWRWLCQKINRFSMGCYGHCPLWDGRCCCNRHRSVVCSSTSGSFASARRADHRGDKTAILPRGLEIRKPGRRASGPSISTVGVRKPDQTVAFTYSHASHSCANFHAQSGLCSSGSSLGC